MTFYKCDLCGQEKNHCDLVTVKVIRNDKPVIKEKEVCVICLDKGFSVSANQGVFNVS